MGHFLGFNHGANFFEGLGDTIREFIARVRGRIEEAVGTGQAGEGSGSQAKGAQVVDGFTIGLGPTEGQDALHGLADEVDFGLEIDGE
jgi:hypothetical protein